MFKSNETELCFECCECCQLLGEDQVKDGAEQGWSHCPGCGIGADYEFILEDSKE